MISFNRWRSWKLGTVWPTMSQASASKVSGCWDSVSLCSPRPNLHLIFQNSHVIVGGARVLSYRLLVGIYRLTSIGELGFPNKYLQILILTLMLDIPGGAWGTSKESMPWYFCSLERESWPTIQLHLCYFALISNSLHFLAFWLKWWLWSGSEKNGIGQQFPKQGGSFDGDGHLWAVGTDPKALWNFLYFHCYLDGICMTPQVAEPSWQWARLGREVRLSVAFEPLYWLHSKPIYWWETLIKGSKIFWFYNELHITGGRVERPGRTKWFFAPLIHGHSRPCELFSHISFLSQETSIGSERVVHSCLSPWKICLYTRIMDTDWENEETPPARIYGVPLTILNNWKNTGLGLRN